MERYAPDGRRVTIELGATPTIAVDGMACSLMGRWNVYRDGGSMRIPFAYSGEEHLLYVNRRIGTEP